MHLFAILFLVFLLAATSAAGLFRKGRQAVAPLSLAASAAIFLWALAFLMDGAGPQDIVLPIGIPALGIHLGMDGLSAFFLVVTGLSGALTSIYSLGYFSHEKEPGRVLPFYPFFLAGMFLVPLARDAFTFLLAWEAMSLLSWALVMAHHREHGTRHAAYVYLLMASFGTFCLIGAFALLASAGGGLSFSMMQNAELSGGMASAVLVLALVGAGSKAGLVPLHVWLPLAHPAAPSPVSALMSGVMTKVAIYGFLRIAFGFLGASVWQWGALVLVVGAVTAVMGVLYALMQHDIKKLLAYHTVENIGLIFMGIGLAMTFHASGLAAGATLALTAALLHTLNHSLFKSLLFLSAGRVIAATGEHDMDKLGGLMRSMPQTALAFLIGAAAISALPPLNGFVSEWLLFQSLLAGSSLPQGILRVLVPVSIVAVALAAALAAACFAKAFGITFLGRPRSPAAAAAREAESPEITAMFIFAGLCVLIGIAPKGIIGLLSPAVAQMTGLTMQHLGDSSLLFLVPRAGGSVSYSGIIIALLLGLGGLAAFFFLRAAASRETRVSPIWDCGTPDDDVLAQYTAGSFAQPIRRGIAAPVFEVREMVDMPHPSDMRAAHFHLHMRDPVWSRLYAPIAPLVAGMADRVNRMQHRPTYHYLASIFMTLIILLVGVALWK